MRDYLSLPESLCCFSHSLLVETYSFSIWIFFANFVARNVKAKYKLRQFWWHIFYTLWKQVNIKVKNILMKRRYLYMSGVLSMFWTQHISMWWNLENISSHHNSKNGTYAMYCNLLGSVHSYIEVNCHQVISIQPQGSISKIFHSKWIYFYSRNKYWYFVNKTRANECLPK